MEPCVEATGGLRPTVQAAAANKLPRRGAPRIREFEIHRRPEAVHEDPSRQVMIGMAGQARIGNRNTTARNGAIAAREVLRKGTGVIEMTLHAFMKGIEALGNRGEVIRIKGVSRDGQVGTGRNGNRLATQHPRGNAVKRLELNVGPQLERMASKMRRHGDIDEQPTGSTSRLARAGTNISHAQPSATHHIKQHIALGHHAGTRARIRHVAGIDKDGCLSGSAPCVPNLELLLFDHTRNRLFIDCKHEYEAEREYTPPF